MSTLDGNAPPGTPPPSRPPVNPPPPPAGPGRGPNNPPPPKRGAAIAFLVALLLLAGCVQSGRVVSHQKPYVDKSGHAIFPICTSSTNKVKCGDVGEAAYRLCKDGDYYNQDLCDSRANRGKR